MITGTNCKIRRLDTQAHIDGEQNRVDIIEASDLGASSLMIGNTVVGIVSDSILAEDIRLIIVDVLDNKGVNNG